MNTSVRRYCWLYSLVVSPTTKSGFWSTWSRLWSVWCSCKCRRCVQGWNGRRLLCGYVKPYWSGSIGNAIDTFEILLHSVIFIFSLPTAACGVPVQQQDHCLRICRFARICLSTFQELSEVLSVKFGPDTSDLELRVGIHTGQVTAGKLCVSHSIWR